MTLTEPTTQQVVLYSRLKAQYGRLPEWGEMMKGRAFERMTPHRAFHFIQYAIRIFEGRITRSFCGCTERKLRETQRHPALTPGARDSARV